MIAERIFGNFEEFKNAVLEITKIPPISTTTINVIPSIQTLSPILFIFLIFLLLL